MDKPVVTTVHGGVTGTGLGLLFSADIAIAASGTKFVFVYPDIGLTPDCGVSYLLPRAIAPRPRPGPDRHNGLYKAELVFWEGPWRGPADLELATLGWVDWFNHTRIHSSLSYRTPAEIEDEYYRQNHAGEQPLAAELAV